MKGEVEATAESQRTQMIKEMVAELESLPDEILEEIRDLVEFLRQRKAQPTRGTPEALLRSFGCWHGPPGELDSLVEEIYEARHQEAENAYRP